MSANIEIVEQQDTRLGRQKYQPVSNRAFATGVTVDRSTWRSKSIRIYDPPYPNPDQRVGCCTAVASANQLNAAGNRNRVRIRPWSTLRSGIINLNDVENMYHRNTVIDPFPGTWPPEDTGSSGWAAAETARALGWGGTYRWIFGGADEVVQNIMAGRVVSVGTWWHWDMFQKSPTGLITPGGGLAGGHQYAIRGYDKYRDFVMGRCWWGPDFRDFWLRRTDLDALLRDGGDAYVQQSL